MNQLFEGDCMVVLDTLDENSVDSVVSDPPYHLTPIVKRFGKEGSAPAKFGTDGAYARASRGFMGKTWDGGDIAFQPDLWAKVYRVMKPGAHLVAFSGDRTYHRMACAIEDAGFEIRRMIGWVYGQGFPKSHNISKALDKAADATREKIATGAPVKRMIPGADQNRDGSWIKDNGHEYQPGIELPATDEARQWDGWGTDVKPALEPICLARKPLSEKSVAANVLRWGTGALNIDACRIETTENLNGGTYSATGRVDKFFKGKRVGAGQFVQPKGRWPANLCLSWPEDEYKLRSDITAEQRRELFGWLHENA